MTDRQQGVDVDLFNLDEIEVTLTYPFLKQKEPIRFFLRPLLDAEEKAARQTFLGLTEAERERKKNDFNIKLLAGLAVREPENLPTFENTGNLAASLIGFFSGGNAMKQKVADDALTIYYGMIQPSEFFRSF